ncbi:hypothetical protein [uncultured Methanobrevibacter sp.]|nr:hypothetical protein [uncultured Methanobrevibacter sp.]
MNTIKYYQDVNSIAIATIKPQPRKMDMPIMQNQHDRMSMFQKTLNMKG